MPTATSSPTITSSAAPLTCWWVADTKATLPPAAINCSQSNCYFPHVPLTFHLTCSPPLLAPQVTLTGGEGRQAKVVGYDDDKDVAVLKIDLKDLVGLYRLHCLWFICNAKALAGCAGLFCAAAGSSASFD
jgi:hypothetical protein